LYSGAYGQVPDPFDTSAGYSASGQGDDDWDDISREDKDKSAEELVAEGNAFLSLERPLDARTKLLLALQKNPKVEEAHELLASYYLVHVGHFRLALKYIKQAQALLEERHGRPPYSDPLVQRKHARILYLLSQIRLDLDNYQGALDVLDEFTSYGYYASWYPGSRAWILMKLGRLEEAIKVARLGMLADAEPGRTLNMLGILLSMHGERQASLQIFHDAISYEYSLGTMGQPATPLNNVGEVLREMFEDDKAEASWLRATSQPDGCEHVLASMNLTLLYIEQQNYVAAKRTMDNFESCVAQYPLRNGEEHRALVGLARGRIAMHTGNVDLAVKLLEESLQRRQWFGKIGTSEEDLEAAASISLAQALNRQSNVHGFRLTTSWREGLERVQQRIWNSVRAWWLMRRGRQVLAEDLSDLEDLSIRNTDAMLEYSTFGEALADLPRAALGARIAKELAVDERKNALPFYEAYLGENALKHGDTSTAISQLQSALRVMRPRYDELLKVHSLLRILETTKPGSAEYTEFANQAFALSNSELRNYGFQLPVNVSGCDGPAVAALAKSAFLPGAVGAIHAIQCLTANDGTLSFTFVPASSNNTGAVKVSGENIEAAINKLNDEVFSFVTVHGGV